VEALTLTNLDEYYNYINNSASFANHERSYYKWHRIYEKSNAPNATKLTVQNLKPFTNYTLRMYSQNVKGKSEPSLPTELFQTQADVPSVTPEYLGARLSSLFKNTSLPNDIDVLIKWSPIPTSKWNGVPQGYVIQLQQCTNINNNKTLKIPFDHLQQTSYLLQGLASFECYLIRMCAWNSVGLGPWTAHTLRINQTSESKPSLGPTNVNLYSINSSCIKVVWTKLSSKFSNGILVGYSVKYTPEGQLPSSAKEVAVDSDLDEYLIYLTGLLSYTNYRIEIAACTRAGCGVSSSPVSLRTLEYLPGKPSALFFPNVTLTSAEVSWSKPERPNGVLSAYRVRYILRREFSPSKPESQQKWSIVYVKNNANLTSYSCEVIGLAKREYYLFEVAANNSGEMGWGEAASALVYTIDQRERPGPPSKPVISKSSVKATEMEISWSSGPVSNYGPIRYFSVEIAEIRSGGDQSGLSSGEVINVDGWRVVVDRFYVNADEDSYNLVVKGNDQNGKLISECIFLLIFFDNF